MKNYIKSPPLLPTLSTWAPKQKLSGKNVGNHGCDVTSHVSNAKSLKWSLVGRKEENCRRMPATAAPPHDNSLSPFIIYLPLGKYYDWSQTARSALIPGRRLPFPASLQLGRVGWPILTNELYIEAPRVPSGQRQWKSPAQPSNSVFPCHCGLESMCWYQETLEKTRWDS